MSINNEITLPIVSSKHSNFPYAFNEDTAIQLKPSKHTFQVVNPELVKLAMNHIEKNKITTVYITKLVPNVQIPTPSIPTPVSAGFDITNTHNIKLMTCSVTKVCVYSVGYFHTNKINISSNHTPQNYRRQKLIGQGCC